MHGRNRSEYKAMQRDPKTAAKLAKKAEQWHTLTAQIVGSSNATANKQSPQQVLALTEKLLTVNPDPLYLWNQRRAVWEEEQTSSSSSSSSSLLSWDVESHLTAVALQANPKAYGAWFHRKWCLVHLVVGVADNAASKNILPQELALTVQFLDRDERNFHCWNFRRFVVSLLLQQQQPQDGVVASSATGEWKIWMGTTGSEDDNDTVQEEPLLLMGAQMAPQSMDATAAAAADPSEPKTTTTTAAADDTASLTDWIQHEWDFTQQKIQQNFSNFSAFHYRSKLYAYSVHKARQTTASSSSSSAAADSTTTRLLLEKELELVENAVFTEPDDQTAWWYQSFLLSVTTDNDNDNNDEGCKAIWRQHVANLQELRDEVPQSKWVVLGLLNCRRALGDNDTEELLRLCETLTELDPDRKGRYASLRRQVEKERRV